MFQSPDFSEFPGTHTRKLLVVDDEPTLRLGFSYALGNSKTKVEIAATGRQALEKLTAEAFDAVILDLRMPDLDGLGVIEGLRGMGNHTPIVLCSAALNYRSALQAILLGVVDFLFKPIRPAELRGMVDFILLSTSQAPLSLAMQAGRRCAWDEAVLCLEREPSTCPRTLAWHRVFSALHGYTTHDVTVQLEEIIREHIDDLCFTLT